MSRISLTLTAFLLLISCSSEENNDLDPVIRSFSEQVAYEYGAENWDQIKSISYTFVIEREDTTIKRKWRWLPPKDSVYYSYRSGDSVINIAFKKSTLDTTSEAMINADMRFINDQYWLLFPLQIMWNEVETEEIASQPAPISGQNATQLNVKFGNGGYTPNDVYELYINEENRIIEWMYKRGGSEENSSAYTWEKHQLIGPLLIAMLHRHQDGKRAIRFEDVVIETTDGEIYR